MAAHVIRLDGDSLTLADVAAFLAVPDVRVELTPEACAGVVRARQTIEAIVAKGDPVYGINTGFGRLADRKIDAARLIELQRNLVLSHCVGVGNPLDAPTARLLILLRANALAKGFSGIRLETLASLLALLHHGVTPMIPERGSVGASGDLAPLAHLAAVLIGEGEAFVNGRRMPGGEALAAVGLEPVVLAEKEGLSLINGTQIMTAIGADNWLRADTLARTADVVCALSADALKGTDRAFDARIHAARPHPGQQAVAKTLRRLLEGSEVRESHRDHHHCAKVQDAYSVRCTPQVHGAVRDALDYVERVLSCEINAATDNPLVFPDQGEAISGGNFHGEPVAIALDLLAIAIAEAGGIAERRLERLVNPDYSALPAFLVRGEQGLHSGFMMAQVTAAALVSENKGLAHPASVDSIPTSAGFEDHVSMGVTAALKARQAVTNAETVLGIELLAAVQAIEFHDPLKTSPPLEAVRAVVRASVARVDGDRYLADDLAAAARLIRSGAVLAAARSVIADL